MESMYFESSDFVQLMEQYQDWLKAHNEEAGFVVVATTHAVTSSWGDTVVHYYTVTYHCNGIW